MEDYLKIEKIGEGWSCVFLSSSKLFKQSYGSKVTSSNRFQHPTIIIIGTLINTVLIRQTALVIFLFLQVPMGWCIRAGTRPQGRLWL